MTKDLNRVTTSDNTGRCYVYTCAHTHACTRTNTYKLHRTQTLFKVHLQNNCAVIFGRFCSEANSCSWAMLLKRAPRLIMQPANAPGIHPRPEIFVLKLFNAGIKVDDLYSVAPARGPPWANLISYQQNGWVRTAAAWWDETRSGTLLSWNYLRLN